MKFCRFDLSLKTKLKTILTLLLIVLTLNDLFLNFNNFLQLKAAADRIHSLSLIYQ